MRACGFQRAASGAGSGAWGVCGRGGIGGVCTVRDRVTDWDQACRFSGGFQVFFEEGQAGSGGKSRTNEKSFCHLILFGD